MLRISMCVGACVLAAIVASTACGSSPTATATTPSSAATVKSVVVSVANVALIGTPVQATATAYFSDGSSTTSGFVFSTSAASVATASATGLVSGVSAGTVTITATEQGQSGNQSIQIVPDYRGHWSGALGPFSCQVLSGAESCADALSGIVSGSVALSLDTQTGVTVAGTVTNLQLQGEGGAISLSIPVTGSVTADGQLLLKGTSTIFAEGLFDLQNWITSLTPAGALTGSVDLVIGVENETTIQLSIPLPSLVHS